MTTAKIRRMLEVIRDELKPCEMLVVTVPPDSARPVTHWWASLELARKHRTVAMSCDASLAAEIVQHLHDLDRNSQKTAVLFPEHAHHPEIRLFDHPRPGQYRRAVSR